MDSIIEQLQKTKEYTVTEIGGEGEKVNTITNYRAINSKYNEADVVSEIATVDMVCRYIDCLQRRPYTERHCR